MMNYEEWAYRYMCKWKTQPGAALDRIVNAIQNNLPLSYVRICDADLIFLKEYFKLIKGDSYYIDLCNADNHLDTSGPFKEPWLNTLSYYASMFQTEIINDYFNNRWGITSDSEKPNIIKTIGESVIYALENSSLIGIWDIEKNVLAGGIGDFYVWTHSYVPHIELFAECGVNFKNITSASVHREPIIGDPLKFREVLNGTPIHIFTSNEHELRNVTKLHELLQTEITYTNLTPIKGDPNSFSFMAHDFLNDRCKDIKEHVILYGLGYGAKYLPSYLSTNYGKCVIDMGAVLDGWAGKITRPYMKENNYMIPNLNDARESWIP
jgi:hypothetical protein